MPKYSSYTLVHLFVEKVLKQNVLKLDIQCTGRLRHGTPLLFVCISIPPMRKVEERERERDIRQTGLNDAIGWKVTHNHHQGQRDFQDG